jgi:phenylacetic acid degradation operon negative regulatory protein
MAIPSPTAWNAEGAHHVADRVTVPQGAGSRVVTGADDAPLAKAGADGVTRRPGDTRQLGQARSKRLLVTLLGDFWQQGRPPIPSAALVRVLEEFGIAPANARAALSRLTQQGMLVRTKEGRRTSYAPTPEAIRTLERGAQRIFSPEDATPWDGTWTLIAFSVASDDGDLRRLLRARLRWLTFAPIFDATWVTPHDRVDLAREQLDELGISDAAVLLSREVHLLPGGRARLEQAWRLERLSADYERFLADHRDLASRAAAGRIGPAEALVQRTQLVDDWRRLIRDDPDLPAEFLPDGFARPSARALFLDVYDTLAEEARLRFEELVAEGTG